MITLYQAPAAWGIPSISPFCIKLETYLRMVGLPYEVRLADVARSPKGKVPYVAIDGRLLGDSQRIIEHLQRVHGDPLDARLTPQARALGHMIRRTLEEGTYWVTVFVRWGDPAGWTAYRPVFEAMLLRQAKSDPLESLRQTVVAAGRAQGTLRHGPEEIHEMGKADIDALAVLLGDQPFVLGDEATSVDATVYATLISLLAFPIDSPVKRHAAEKPNLVAYCERMKRRYYADWEPPAISIDFSAARRPSP
jgi:glutathione S-transferase